MTDRATTGGDPLPWEFTEHAREAIAGLSEAIATGPAGADALVSRAIIHRVLGEFEQAISDLDGAVAAYPLDPTVRCARGITLLLSGQVAAAASDFDEAAELDVWDIETHYQRIAAHVALGQWREAAAALDAFVDPRAKASSDAWPPSPRVRRARRPPGSPPRPHRRSPTPPARDARRLRRPAPVPGATRRAPVPPPSM